MGNPEKPDKAPLTPTASFVAGREGILTLFVTPELRKRGLIESANRVIEAIRNGELKPDDGEVIEFALALREVKSIATTAIEAAKKRDGDQGKLERALAVVNNYTKRLITAIEDSGEYRENEPKESDIA